MSPVVLGVEGAGVRTDALVCDESGRVRGAAATGPSNWEIVSIGDLVAHRATRFVSERRSGRPHDRLARRNRSCGSGARVMERALVADGGTPRSSPAPDRDGYVHFALRLEVSVKSGWPAAPSHSQV